MTVPRPRSPRLIHPAKLPATTPPPLTAAWTPADTSIDRAELLPLPVPHPAEDVAIAPDGTVYCGTEDGRIWRRTPPDPTNARDHAAHTDPADPDGTRGRGALTGLAHTDGARGAFTELANTGGRPLGIEVDPADGSLIVCDAYRGLLRIFPSGEICDLTNSAAGTPILFCNNAAIATDGTVYFTDSSNRYPLSHWRRDLLEHRPNGRVLAYDPRTGETTVLATDLYFPNGVALSRDNTTLLVCETVAHRLSRIALPSLDVTELMDLPAYPDNMSSAPDGTFWIALASPRVAIAERLLPHPRIRQLVAALPTSLQPGPKPHTIVAQVDDHGTVLRTLHGPTGHYPMLTGVRQHADTLWFASLTEPSLARVKIPPATANREPSQQPPLTS